MAQKFTTKLIKLLLALWAVLLLPTMAQADTVTFDYTGGVQSFTVQSAGNYQILAYGAQGGHSLYCCNDYLAGIVNRYGGNGAEMGGNVFLSAGTIVDIYVGGAGATKFQGSGAGGGGGTFVVVEGSANPFVVAGGGGGAGGLSGFNYHLGQANGQAGQATVVNGGNGGAGSNNSQGSGGGGFFSSGGNNSNGLACCQGYGGGGFPSLQGGTDYYGAPGGYGGGGAGGFYGGGAAADQQAEDMKASIAAAKQSADAAKIAAEHVPKTERAYVFLELKIESNVENIFYMDPASQVRRPEIIFGFRNHGRTPAIVQSLQVGAKYWDMDASPPHMNLAHYLAIQPGLVISSDPVGGYKIEFDFTREQDRNVRQGRGCVMLWGRIVYLDVFQERHETGWCRAHLLNGKQWKFGGDSSLNYYT